MYTCRCMLIRPILGFWGSYIPQNGIFSAQDADYRAKFDADGFIYHCRRNHSRTKLQKQTNSKQYIHTLPLGMCG